MLKFFFVFLLLIPSHNIFASEFLDEVKEDALSPFQSETLPILEIGAGMTLLTLAFKEEFKQDLQQKIAHDRPLRNTSKYGDFLGHLVPNLVYVLGMGSDYLITHDQKSLDRSILMTKATLYSGIMTDVLKRVVRERRPNGSTYSFPSGHTTTAFAFSSVVMMEHSMPWGIAANSMAAFVGFSRMNDNAHYLNDVLAGATIGTMYGVGLFYAKRHREEKKANSSVFMILPIEKGLQANYSFDF